MKKIHCTVVVLLMCSMLGSAQFYAWNNLGLVYMQTRQDDLAVSAFQKQIEVNPYDEYAYNNLGRVY